MKRRQFLALGIAVPAALVATPAVIAANRDYDLDGIIAELVGLPLQSLRNTGDWNISQVFQHCAQSIQYSLDGYPQMFSRAFQNTAGVAAATVFRAMGSMRHNLNEEIPGAGELDPDLALEIARAQLISAIEAFQQFEGELQPHFAYGSLDKEAYTAAHVLHVQNHLRAFVAV